MNTDDNILNKYDEFYPLSLLKNQSSNSLESTFPNQTNHYFCPECKKFPFIKFKSKKEIRVTCSCKNNQNISITTFLNYSRYKLFSKEKTETFTNNNNNSIDKDSKNQTNTTKEYIDILATKSPINEQILSKDEINEIEKSLMCIEHNKKFEYFCKSCLNNLCLECKEHICDSNDLYDFKELNDIYNKKIDYLKNYINNNNIGSLNSFDIKKSVKENDEDVDFKNLINIIINDYNKFPNYSHFFNIENILLFLNIKEMTEYKENKDNN